MTFGHACMQFGGRDVVARKDIGGYWKNAMDSQAMPEAIQGRIDHPQTAGKGVRFAKDFDPESDASKNTHWSFRKWGKPHAGDLTHPEADSLPITKPKP